MNNVSSKTVVYISVLNWHKVETTLICLEYLLKLDIPNTVTVKIFIVDNGSSQDDWLRLSNGIKNNLVTAIHLEENLGFTGGHNVIMQKALDDNADYVWLVNNDGIVSPETLTKIIDSAEKDRSCGAVSPLIVRLGNEEIIDFCGAYHDWGKLDSISLDCNAHETAVTDWWLTGAAIFFRVKALKEVGLLDDSFFAYYEDNDICARLVNSGWKIRIAADAHFQHDVPTERQPYFYYLTARNGFFFWLRHTPKGYRRFIRLRLLERAIFSANKLVFDGKSTDKVNAYLLGILDGLLGRGGRPNFINRKVPWFMVLLRKARWLSHRHHNKHRQIPSC